MVSVYSLGQISLTTVMACPKNFVIFLYQLLPLPKNLFTWLHIGQYLALLANKSIKNQSGSWLQKT